MSKENICPHGPCARIGPRVDIKFVFEDQTERGEGRVRRVGEGFEEIGGGGEIERY